MSHGDEAYHCKSKPRFNTIITNKILEIKNCSKIKNKKYLLLENTNFKGVFMIRKY